MIRRVSEEMRERAHGSCAASPIGIHGTVHGNRDHAPIIAFLFCLAVAAVFLAVSSDCRHWLVIPVFLCGVLVTADALDWLLGRMKLFDPAGLIGIVGIHFFFLAPLLHVGGNWWLTDVSQPADWRPWMGGMATLNLLGLLAYRACRGNPSPVAVGPSRPWQLVPRRFGMLLVVSVLCALAAQVWLYSRQGGIGGYIAAFQEEGHLSTGDGKLIIIAHSFPILVLMGWALRFEPGSERISLRGILGAFVLFFALTMLFGGLDGSRSRIIWRMFWAVGVVHLWIRPLPRKLVLMGFVAAVGFLYIYGFYKGGGTEGLRAAFSGSYARRSASERTGRSLTLVLMGDISRSDVQAAILHGVWRSDSRYHLGFGRTYLGAAAQLVPRSIWPNRPPTKVKEGSDVLYGEGFYYRDRYGADTFRDRGASKVYGLAGEAMLNFGPFGVPVAFGVLGLFVRRVRLAMAQWHAEDVRRLLLPLLSAICVSLLAGDSDGLLFFVLSFGLLPFLVLLVGSRRQRGRDCSVASGAGACS